MSKMGHNKNKSVDELIAELPRQEQIIVSRLRMLILSSLPGVTEKNLFGAPFYTHHRMICYLWPPSFYWGKKNRTLSERGVVLGFCQGHKMSNEDGALLREGRKQVYCMYFNSVKEINDDQVCALLFEADLIDREFKRRTKSKGRA